VEDRTKFLLGDFGEPLLQRLGTGNLDLVVCNPPYGATSRAEEFESQVVQFEPHLALFGGEVGTEAIQRIVPQAGLLLRAGGILLIEIGMGQSEKVAGLFEGSWSRPEVYPDLRGIPRCVQCEKR
jgi:release factor glutamine methyltransferase